MLYSPKIREEELKNRVAADFFGKYDCTGIIKDIDFAVKAPPLPLQRRGIEVSYLLWAEAKKNATDIIAMLAQLVLTIGKARTFNEVLPPKFLGCFDCEKIAFVPYSDIQDIFHQNDFNWNVAPSNRDTKEFRQIYVQIDRIINSAEPHKTYRFDFEKDEKSLKLFILKNFMPGGEISKIRIDKNNFISVYAKWLEAVKPTIAVNWDGAKKRGIIDGDFYLADLLSSENKTLKEKLYVLLNNTFYVLDKQIDSDGFLSHKEVNFNDSQKAHSAFWAIYERPPREDYWDYIIERRDLLVPQDVRERKGSFFTPKIWVELSQKYIADVLGENWQEEYYVWDCAAGTGNLLAGLTNKYNVWASTLDKADVDVMHDRIENGANLLKEHCFQFDFLNDEFEKLPVGLRKIIDDPKKRKKLIVYINPPYAEAGIYGRESKSGVSTTKIKEKYKSIIGYAATELYVQFLSRIYGEIGGCKIANFSTLKTLHAPNFSNFRNFFLAKLEKLFIVPADTFDNVSGQFPIGFFTWDTGKKEKFKEIIADVLDENGIFIERKKIYGNLPKSVNKWIAAYNEGEIGNIGFLSCATPMFQNQNYVYIEKENKQKISHYPNLPITKKNLIPACIYFAVRHCIPATWLNDRDQFLYPNDGWETDLEFQSDCLAYTLFHGQNNISCKNGSNHWIPFIEWDVSPRDRFDSHFMTDFIAGKIKTERRVDLFVQNHADTKAPPSAAHPAGKAGTPLGEGNCLMHNEGSFKIFDIRKLPFNPKLKSFAKENRKAGWLHESVFWERIKGKQICGLDFHRQQIIGNYIVDYFSPIGGIIIEIGGKSHEAKVEYDKIREEYLKSLGLTVIHISAKDILQNLDASIEYLKEEIKNIKEEKFPSPRGVPALPAGCAAVGGAVKFSSVAKNVFNAGRELWKYYHNHPCPSKGGEFGCDVNASLYDIREHFQGRNANGKMNAKSDDEKYNELIGNLRSALKILAKKIEPKVYEYGFLKE